MDRKQWNRIGLATVAALLVPGGFLLGAALFARRPRATAKDERAPPESGPEVDAP